MTLPPSEGPVAEYEHNFKAFRDFTQTCRWPDDIKEKDINDMVISGKTKDEIQTIIKNNTYQGNMAKIRFTTWRKRNA